MSIYYVPGIVLGMDVLVYVCAHGCVCARACAHTQSLILFSPNIYEVGTTLLLC